MYVLTCGRGALKSSASISSTAFEITSHPEDGEQGRQLVNVLEASSESLRAAGLAVVWRRRRGNGARSRAERDGIAREGYRQMSQANPLRQIAPTCD